MGKEKNFSDIAVLGMGTMGANLARNMANRGFSTLLWNRSLEKAAFIAGENPLFRVAVNLEEISSMLEPPRKVLLMLPAGKAAAGITEQLKGILEAGDIVINGANSPAEESDDLCASLSEKEILYVGLGISGGARGALEGPAFMAGGSAEAWEAVRPLLEKCAADSPYGGKCAAWFGKGGAGHLVKIVHNGIEYAQMQIIAEIYDVLKNGFAAPVPVIAEFFAEQSRHCGCRSFLLDLTVNILREQDPETGSWLIDTVADTAAHKGTGLTCLEYALQNGIPVPALTQAVLARQLSTSAIWRKNRVPAVCSNLIKNKDAVSLDSAGKVMRAALLEAFAEGFALLKGIFDSRNIPFDPALAARTWSNGCIIRSELLEIWLKETPPAAENSVFPPDIDSLLLASLPSWQSFAAMTAKYGIPVPAISAALDYYILSSRPELPTALTAAQRDAFGNHLFRKKNTGEAVHFDWRTP